MAYHIVRVSLTMLLSVVQRKHMGIAIVNSSNIAIWAAIANSSNIVTWAISLVV